MWMILAAVNCACAQEYAMNRESLRQFNAAPPPARDRWVVSANRDTGEPVLVRPAALHLLPDGGGPAVHAVGRRVHDHTTWGLIVLSVGATLAGLGALPFTLDSCVNARGDSCIAWDILGFTLLAIGGSHIMCGGAMALGSMARRDAEVPPGKNRFLYH